MRSLEDGNIWVTSSQLASATATISSQVCGLRRLSRTDRWLPALFVGLDGVSSKDQRRPARVESVGC
jgi:hypothetical protein